MEVILLERVAKLGQMGEVVRVKDGFARNFLLKRGKALRATADNRAKFDGMKAELEARILASFDEVTARRQASVGAAIAKLGERVRDAVWPGAPAWKPASVLALSLAVGILAGNYLPLNGVVSDQTEQTASVTLDAPPAFDLDENS